MAVITIFEFKVPHQSVSLGEEDKPAKLPSDVCSFNPPLAGFREWGGGYGTHSELSQ